MCVCVYMTFDFFCISRSLVIPPVHHLNVNKTMHYSTIKQEINTSSMYVNVWNSDSLLSQIQFDTCVCCSLQVRSWLSRSPLHQCFCPIVTGHIVTTVLNTATFSCHAVTVPRYIFSNVCKQKTVNKKSQSWQLSYVFMWYPYFVKWSCVWNV